EGQAGSSFTCSPYYRGESEASEPETMAIETLIASLIPDQRGIGTTDAAPEDTTGVFVQLHSPFRTVTWPWAYDAAPAPNAAGLEAIGQKLADLTGYAGGQTFDVVYQMTGTADDWVYGELGAPAFLIEVGEGLMPAYHRIDSVIWPETRDALVYAAKIARTPYRDARGPDVSAVQVSAVAGGVDVTATAADTQDIGQPGQAIAAVEASLTPPWETGASPIALGAQDGSFDSVTETAVGTVDTTSLGSGTHLLWVRAQDVNGDWGPPTAAWITVP
ncbi:MAG: M14 family zinc carboxypeptidase, partial [Acidobacteriota bacterium]